jgi:hypothetical protein
MLLHAGSKTDEKELENPEETDDRVNDALVMETLQLLDEGRRRITYHPKKEYVLIVGKAGTGDFSSRNALK